MDTGREFNRRLIRNPPEMFITVVPRMLEYMCISSNGICRRQSIMNMLPQMSFMYIQL